MKSLPILLAVDFDLTIADSKYPTINGLRKGAKKYINKLVEKGFYITIWTCRTDGGINNDLRHAVEFLAKKGVHFHGVNENHTALIKCFKNDCRKISADLYIDDKGLWLFGIPSWFWLYWLIRLKAFFLPDKKRILSHCKPEDFF